MEIIDKEQLATNHAQEETFELQRKATNPHKYYSYLSGFNEAESIYLKQIEEKDKDLKEYDLETARNLTNILKLKKEIEIHEISYGELGMKLQYSKELLKQVVLHLDDGIGNDGIKGMIEEFLKK